MSVWGDLIGFAEGAGESAANMVYEPLATAYDLELIAYYTIIAEPDKFQPTSSIGKAATGGYGTSEIIGGMAIGAAMIPVDYAEAIVSGDSVRIGAATFNLELLLFGGSRVKLSSATKRFISSGFKKFVKNNKKSCSFLVKREVVASKNTGTLTNAERNALQNIADKYNAEIDVVGSRAAGKGRNIDTDLPVGKDLETTRSDIDVKVDGQAVIDSRGQLADDLKNIGDDPNLVQVLNKFVDSDPPVITIKPRR